MKKCTLPKIYFLLSFLVLFISTNVFAQPANDDCANATAITIGADGNACSAVEGTTLDATQSVTPVSVCSGSWFADDVWYTLTTPNELPNGTLIIETEFGSTGTDVIAVGMAIYAGCGENEAPLVCFSNGDGTQTDLLIFTTNLQPNTDYYIRVWSGGSPTDNSGTFRICSYWGETDDDVVLWGTNPGEGDFDGGLNDWTVSTVNVDSALWAWKGCACSNGSFRSGTISSPTSFNGAMVFDADSINTPGGNVPPGPPYPRLTGELISPVIDGTDFGPVSLKFYHAYGPLNSFDGQEGTALFAYSLDGGDTWSPSIPVSPEVAPNDLAPVPEVKRFFLPELQGEPNIRIKFIFDGDFYYWIVDDVQLIEPENNNLVVMDNFYAIAPNAMWPQSQLEPFSFLADVANVGAAAQPNTILNMSITNGAGTEVYNEDLAYGTLDADSLYENVPFNGTFDPSGSEIGTVFTGTYSIQSDSLEFDPSDNSRTFSFMVSDSIFAKEMGPTRTVVPAQANWADGESHSWAYGNFFHIVTGTNFDNPELGWDASAATFGIGNAADVAGRLVTVNLYHWVADSNEDGNMDPDERTVVGFNIYEITGDEASDQLITIPLMPFPQGEGNVPILSGENYVVMVEYNTSDEVDLALSGAEPWDYAAQTFRSNLEDQPYRPAEMLGISGDLTTEPYSAAGFTGTVVPTVRLHISQPEIVIDVNELAEENLVQLSPNPASDFINVQIDLVNQQSEVQVQVLDVTGKVIINRYYDNVQTETFDYNVSNLAVGSYIFNFITKEGMRTERFVVQR